MDSITTYAQQLQAYCYQYPTRPLPPPEAMLVRQELQNLAADRARFRIDGRLLLGELDRLATQFPQQPDVPDLQRRCTGLLLAGLRPEKVVFQIPANAVPGRPEILSFSEHLRQVCAANPTGPLPAPERLRLSREFIELAEDHGRYERAASLLQQRIGQIVSDFPGQAFGPLLLRLCRQLQATAVKPGEPGPYQQPSYELRAQLFRD